MPHVLAALAVLLALGGLAAFYASPWAFRALPPGAVVRSCDEARALGAAPIFVTQPGYAEWLDRDGDGIACEPFRDGPGPLLLRP